MNLKSVLGLQSKIPSLTTSTNVCVSVCLYMYLYVCLCAFVSVSLCVSLCVCLYIPSIRKSTSQPPLDLVLRSMQHSSSLSFCVQFFLG